MKGLPELLLNFDPISLKEMDDVALLDRTDTKFTFSEENLKEYLSELKNDYYVLEVKGKRSTTYETIYFDNQNFDFYLRHHNQKLNRFKARYRKYSESDLYFFEIKFKSNKGLTHKKRVKCESFVLPLAGKQKDLFEKHTKLLASNFKPCLWVNYTRTTFVSKRFDERLTVDTDLEFMDSPDRESAVRRTFDGLVIAEVKQKKKSFNSPFVRLMHNTHMRTLSMSKYCIGIASLHPELKNNNFKTKFLTINKILNGNNLPSAVA